MKAAKTEFPFRWPFPPRPKAQRPRRCQGIARSAAPFSRKAMLADVVLVIFWGASIPGLMWLGAAGGF